MPKVQIIYTDFTGEYDDFEVLRKAGEWEEVTFEEAKLITKWLPQLPTDHPGYTARLVILPEERIPVTIETIRKMAMEKEKQAAEHKAKQLARAREREARKDELERAKKLKLLKELKKELGEA